MGLLATSGKGGAQKKIRPPGDFGEKFASSVESAKFVVKKATCQTIVGTLSMKRLTAFLCTLLLTTLVALAGDKFPDISLADLKKAIVEKRVTLIDVNGSETYKVGHIPGALDFETAEAGLAAKLPAAKGALVVAYCADEHCGAFAFAAAKARELGYTNVRHYSPGIVGWKKAGEKTEPGA